MERRHLLDEFATAVSEYLRLESAQFAAAAAGDEEASFLADIEAALERKEAAKQAISDHQKRHGC